MKKQTKVWMALALSAALGLGNAEAKLNPERKLATAKRVYRELLQAPDHEIPEELLSKCHCIAVIPRVIKGAFGWGGRHGRGVLTCRAGERWSPPIFVSLSGGSFGFQVGARSTDVVLFFMSERSVRSLLRSKFTLGGEVGLAAGPLGRTAEMGTDLRLEAEIYSYARSRGLFAGIAVEGARLAPHQKSIDAFYGDRLWPEEVLFKETVAVPPAAKEFLAALP